MSFRHFRNEKGMSLIEVMVSIGISMIVSFVMATMMANMSNDQKALQEKYTVLELKNTVLSALSNPAICAAQLGAGSPTLNLASATATQPAAQVLHYTALRLGENSQSALIAQVGQPLPGANPGQLVVSKIDFGEILSSGVPNTYIGNLTIEIDPKTMTRPQKALQIRQIFNTNGPPGSAKIVGCGSGSAQGFTGTPVGIGTFTGSYTGTNNLAYPILVTANDGKTSLGPGDTRSNSCNLNGFVGSALIIHQVDNNTDYYKACTINFWVPAGQSYTVTSNPWPLGNGTFWLLETH